LASGVLPPGVDRSAAAANASANGFAALLTKARQGGISSGRDVTVGAGVSMTLADADVARLSAAADVLEAAGATQAMVVLNGQALHLDVSGRLITGVHNTSDASVITGIDAFIDLDNMGFGLPADTVTPTRTGSSLLESLGLGSRDGVRQAS
jgi:hypothetical protein